MTEELHTASERSVLGAVLLDPAVLGDVDGIVQASDFAGSRHRLVFQAMIDIAAAGEAVDLLTLTSHLEAAGQLDAAGGVEYLSQLDSALVGAANVASHARIVRDHANERRQDAERQRIASLLDRAASRLQSGAPLPDVLDQVEALLMEATPHESPEMEHIDTVATRFYERVEAVKMGDARDAFLTTGIPDLDRFGKLFYGSFPVLAARPGKGKSTLALNIIPPHLEAMAGVGGVLIHSFEMAAEESYAKLLADTGTRVGVSGKVEGVSVEAMLDESNPGSRGWDAMNRGARRLKGKRIWLNTAHNRLGDVLRISRKAIRRHGVRLIIVDYLQLIEHKAERRHEAVAEISRSLRMLALQETAAGRPCVVLAVSQLNRPREGQEHLPPTMSNLRESGQIEQDATHIWFLHDMDDVPEPRDQSQRQQWEERRGHVLLFTPKQRLSASGRGIYLRKQLEFSRFVPSSLREVANHA